MAWVDQVLFLVFHYVEREELYLIEEGHTYQHRSIFFQDRALDLSHIHRRNRRHLVFKAQHAKHVWIVEFLALVSPENDLVKAVAPEQRPVSAHQGKIRHFVYFVPYVLLSTLFVGVLNPLFILIVLSFLLHGIGLCLFGFALGVFLHVFNFLVLSLAVISLFEELFDLQRIVDVFCLQPLDDLVVDRLDVVLDELRIIEESLEYELGYYRVKFRNC